MKCGAIEIIVVQRMIKRVANFFLVALHLPKDAEQYVKQLEMLQSFCAQTNTANVNTEFSQISGSPSRVICDLALNWGADLIVIGRRGHSGLAELFLGSVSNYVLHHAPCSVHVVQLPVGDEETEVVKESVGASTSS